MVHSTSATIVCRTSRLTRDFQRTFLIGDVDESFDGVVSPESSILLVILLNSNNF